MASESTLADTSGWNANYGTSPTSSGSWSTEEDAQNGHTGAEIASSNAGSKAGEDSLGRGPLSEDSDAWDDSLLSQMADTIYVAYRDPSWQAKVAEYRDVEPSEFRSLPAQDLSEWISYQVPVGDNLAFEKIVILKEDDLVNLKKRLKEFLKQEDCKMVNFGIFSTVEKELVVACFGKIARSIIRKDLRTDALGRIWRMELNGSGKGCGIIAADEKIHTWTDI